MDFPIDPVVAPLTPDAFRRQVKSLIESYHATDTDFVAEILQNSVDALEDRFSTSTARIPPRINLEVDTNEGSLVIADNGPGLTDDVISKLARPNFTNKSGRRRRGHKGVGLSFAAWTSTRFHFATKRAGEPATIAGRLVGALDWVGGRLDDYPRIEEDRSYRPEFLEENDSGTVFRFALGNDNKVTTLLRRLNDRGIDVLLRMFTAAGYADLPHLDRQAYPGWIRACEFNLRIDGGQQREIPLGYLYPHELLGRDAFDLAQLADLTIAARNRVLHRRKCIYVALGSDQIAQMFDESTDDGIASIVRAQRVAVYAAFLDAASRFKDVNDGLFSVAAGRGRRRQLFAPGIHFVTATMPAGEIVDIQLPFGSGNKDRLFVIIQMADAMPDLGRKTFSWEIVEMAQRIVRKLVGKSLVPNRELLIEHEIPHGTTEAQQLMAVDLLKALAIGKPDLDLRNLGITKDPQTEQDVVALFHSLLGKGYLHGYQILAVYGSTRKYDAVFRYSLLRRAENLVPQDPLGLTPDSFGQLEAIEFPPSIMEFKPVLSNLVTDFEEGSKSFEDILMVVAWDVGEPQAFGETSQYSIEPIDASDARKQFHGETHLLSTTGLAKKIHVMLLKHVIHSLVSRL